MVAEKRQRANLADDMNSISANILSALSRVQSFQEQPGGGHVHLVHMNKQKALDYLFMYQDFKFYYIIHALEKLTDNYYAKEGGAAKEVKSLSQGY